MSASATEVVPGNGIGEDRPGPLIRRRSWFKATARRWVFSACGVKERLAAGSGLLLTFDDGPDPDVTPAVLELLARYHARAVFFVVGNRIPRRPICCRGSSKRVT